MAALMTVPRFKYIYGPVHSWRMGMSLGIDPLTSSQKYCNYNCPYCQLGLSERLSVERRECVSTASIVEEVQAFPTDGQIDYLTFSGNGEPTLAVNLGDMIRALRAVRSEKIAVITNSSTVMRPDVRADLRLTDLVLFKIDAADQHTFEAMNHPAPGIKLDDIVRGIKEFKKTFEGRLALQIMFTAANQSSAADIARIARDIAPDEVQLNTPLRPSPVKPLSEAEMAKIKAEFAGLNVRSVYEEEKKDYNPLDESATVQRHGRYQKNLEA